MSGFQIDSFPHDDYFIETYGKASMITDSLEFYFDAGLYESYPKTGSIWYDLSGNNNHASMTGSVPFYEGKGGYFQFENQDGYFSIDSLPNISNNYSIVAWVKYIPDVAGTKFILDFRDGATDGIFLGANAGSGQIRKNSTDLVFSKERENEWIMVTGYISSFPTLYINTAFEVGSIDATSFSVTTKPKIGTRSFSTPANYMSGSVAMVAGFSKVLTTNEIEYIYKGTRNRFLDY